MKTKLGIVAVLVGVWLVHSPRVKAQAGPAQQAGASSNNTAVIISDKDIELLRKDMRSQKKQLIASNLKLTDAEATKFWPIYDRYTEDTIKVNDTKFALIREYAQNWGTLTDEQALSYIKRWLAADDATAQLRSRYVAEVEKVLPGVKAATFFQMDRRITMMIDLQLASQLPLVQAQQ